MELSKDMGADEAINQIAQTKEIETLKSFIKGDTRKTVKAAAKEREKVLKELPGNDLKNQIKRMQEKNAELTGELQKQISDLQTENDSLKKGLTKALKDNKVNPELREEIKREVLKEIAEEQAKLSEETKEEKEEPEKKESVKTRAAFIPAHSITVGGVRYDLQQNPTGYAGAWTKERAEINENLFKSQNIKTKIVEIPEEDKSETKPDECFLIYKCVTVPGMANVEFKEQ